MKKAGKDASRMVGGTSVWCKMDEGGGGGVKYVWRRRMSKEEEEGAFNSNLPFVQVQ